MLFHHIGRPHHQDWTEKTSEILAGFPNALFIHDRQAAFDFMVPVFSIILLIPVLPYHEIVIISFFLTLTES